VIVSKPQMKANILCDHGHQGELGAKVLCITSAMDGKMLAHGSTFDCLLPSVDTSSAGF
jgi:hypothetical protein